MDETTTEVRWLTTTQVAARCGVPVNMVRRWRKGAAKMGPKFYKLSQNTVRYQENDVDEWLARQAVEPMG